MDVRGYIGEAAVGVWDECAAAAAELTAPR
jgi:hypothetical protein